MAIRAKKSAFIFFEHVPRMHDYVVLNMAFILPISSARIFLGQETNIVISGDSWGRQRTWLGVRAGPGFMFLALFPCPTVVCAIRIDHLFFCCPSAQKQIMALRKRIFLLCTFKRHKIGGKASLVIAFTCQHFSKERQYLATSTGKGCMYFVCAVCCAAASLLCDSE
jgi:hypothetical protein